MSLLPLTKRLYLYGEDAVIDEVAADIIVRRVETLKDLRSELLEVNYFIRDDERIRAISREIYRWETIND